MKIENVLPFDIEKRSMEIIDSEMGEASHLTEQERTIVKRVVHATADFDFVKNLKFSKDAIESGRKAFRDGAVIITDTHMAEAGISKPAAQKLGCDIHCFMSDEDVVIRAKQNDTTRAVVSMDKAVELYSDKPLIFAIGNAPTALIRLHELIQAGDIKPALVIGAPVGFVNIIISKELIMQDDIPYIVAVGRKGGSNVAAAICNAILYQIYDRNKEIIK